MPALLHINDRIEVTTERLAYGGEAIARHQGMTVFVREAAAGERLRVRITEVKKSFARARVEEILVASPDRREPPCPYAGDCGGCQLQHLTYTAQLRAKAEFVADALRRIGHLNWQPPIEIRAAAEFGYRLRAGLKAQSDGGHLKLGFYKTGSHEVCDVSACPLLLPPLNAVLPSLRTALESKPPRQAVPLEIELAAGDNGVALAASGNHLVALEGTQGAAVLTEARRQVGDFAYRFSPAGFFQVNALLLDEFVAAAIADAEGEQAIDCFAGVGLFTLPLARRFRQVIGVEASREAVAFARRNALENGVTNATFYRQRVDLWLKQRAGNKKAGRADFILLDPPRSGARDAVEPLLQLAPARLTYVSCEPTTLARDLRAFAEGGYQPTRIVAFDLFPQTYHVETIVSLEKS